MVTPKATIKEGINTYFQLNPKISFRITSIKVGVIVAISPTANSPNVKNIEPNIILIVFIEVFNTTKISI
jgi:hypothetical protein